MASGGATCLRDPPPCAQLRRGPRRLTGTVLPAVTATRYVTPLREGGSLPGLMEADDLGTYVVKWRGARLGVTVLVAEVVCGELRRALGRPVSPPVAVHGARAPRLGEPDGWGPEVLQGPAGRD